MDAVRATSRYLAALRSSTTPDLFEETKREHAVCLALQLQAGALSADEAGDVLQELHKAAVWQKDDLRHLTTAVTQAARASGPAAVSRGLQVLDATARVRLQDYSDFPAYLTQALWSRLQIAELQLTARLGSLCQFLLKLGLRNPTEGTAQAVTSLAYHLPGGPDQDKDSCTARHESFLAVKSLLRRHCQQAAPKPREWPYVLQLPTLWTEHPSQWRACAFGDARPGEPAVDPEAIRGFAGLIPMRKTHGDMRAAPKPAGDLRSTALQLLFAQLFRAKTFSPETSALEPRLEIFNRSRTSLTESDLARLAHAGGGRGDAE